jgi:hypothetical protein
MLLDHRFGEAPVPLLTGFENPVMPCAGDTPVIF